MPGMKKDSIDRHAVPDNKLRVFMGIVYSMMEPFGVTDAPDVVHYVELLAQSIDRHIADGAFVGSSHRTVAARKKFIAIFNNRYLHLTDLENPRRITGVEAKLITQVTDVMDSVYMDIDEYLKWLFETFLSENPKFCPPTIKFACSNFVVEKFKFDFKDVIKQRREDAVRKKDSLDLIGRARAIIREAKDQGVKNNALDALQLYRDGGIIEKLRQSVEELESKIRTEPERQG
jgi:hypothetical protein